MPGGLKHHWIAPKVAARPDDTAYIAAHAHSSEFRAATVVAHHPTYMLVTWDDASANGSSEKPKPDVVSRESTSVWHGSISDDTWEASAPGVHIPKSRLYCPETYKQIAVKHGVDPPPLSSKAVVPSSGARGPSRQATVPPVSSSATKAPPAAGPTSGPPRDACTPPSTAANSAEAAPADNASGTPAPATASPAAAENGFTNHDRDAENWLQAVRRYGEHISDPVLQQMPRFLGLRRDLFVQSYALWLVVMVRLACYCSRLGSSFRVPPVCLGQRACWFIANVRFGQECCPIPFFLAIPCAEEPITLPSTASFRVHST